MPGFVRALFCLSPVQAYLGSEHACRGCDTSHWLTEPLIVGKKSGGDALSVQLTFGSVNFAKLSVSGLQGIQMLGGYGLAFNIRTDTMAWTQPEQAVTIESWSLNLFLIAPGGTDKLVGQGTSLYPQTIKSYSFPNDANTHLMVRLTAEQFALLEVARAGRNLTFKLDLKCYCSGNVGSDPAPGGDPLRPTYRSWTPEKTFCQAIIDYEVPIKEWQKVLQELDFLDLMVFPITFPSKLTAANLQPAQRMLRQAQDHFLHGRYGEVVSLSRKLMESIRDALSQKPAIDSALHKFKTQKDSMTKAERSLMVQEAVRHYSHPAHHVDKATGNPEWYSRDDAMFVLATSAAVFAEAIAQSADDQTEPEISGAK